MKKIVSYKRMIDQHAEESTNFESKFFFFMEWKERKDSE